MSQISAETSISSLFRLVVEEQWEVHYAPMSGGISLAKGLVAKNPEGWEEHYELMQAFLEYRKTGEIVFKDTANYGHSMFNGHSGRVDTYVWKDHDPLPH